MDELRLAVAESSGVFGTVSDSTNGTAALPVAASSSIALPSTFAASTALRSHGPGFRMTIRTACPDAKAPRIPITPAARRRPPDSRLERT